MSINLDKTFQKFQEYVQTFFQKTKAENQKDKLILIIHSMNLSFELKCTGLMEDDLISEENILPEKWNLHLDQVYSFRYEIKKQQQKNQQCFFKLIVNQQMIDINCAIEGKSDKLYQYEFNLDNFSIENINNIENKYQLIKGDYEKYYNKLISQIEKDEDKEKQVILEPNQEILNDNRNNMFWGPRNRFEQVGINNNNGNIRPMIIGGPQDLQPFGMFPNNNNNHNNNGIRYDPVGPIDINNPFPSLRPRNNNPFDISNPFGNNNNHNSFGYNPNRFF